LALAHSGDIRHIRKPYFPPDNINPGLYGIPQPIFRTDDPHNYLILPIISGDQQLGEAHVVYTTEQINDQIRQARQRTILLTLVLLLFGVGAIYLLSNYFVRPIAKITNRIRRYASGDLESEMPLEGAEEFFEISRAFNEMMTRLNRDQETIVARETMAKEIELASQIQKTLLPKELPEIPGLEIEAFYRAASLVGGDLYDVFRIGLSRYCLTVADVSGKGVPASLVMSMLRTVIQIYAARGASAKDTLIQVNEYLEQAIPPGIFITVLLIFYDAISNRIDVVSAGHNPIVFFRAGNKEIAKVNPSGMPLGMPSALEKGFGELLQEVGIDLEPGDTFVAYTDGLTETTNRDGQQYGIDRLCRLMEDQLRTGGKASLADLNRRIVADVEEFGAYLRPKDDITFILARCDADGKSGTTRRSDEAEGDHPEVDIRHVRDSSPSSPSE
jgi:sigma-B regulation protein RsbU (phosphoserine phosphatase)